MKNFALVVLLMVIGFFAFRYYEQSEKIAPQAPLKRTMEGLESPVKTSELKVMNTAELTARIHYEEESIRISKNSIRQEKYSADPYKDREVVSMQADLKRHELQLKELMRLKMNAN